MRLIGFNFTKINIERLENSKEKLNITTNINIVSIEKTDTGSFELKDDVLAVEFTYFINYEPNFAKIEFKGNILLYMEPKQSKELLKSWEKKELPDDIRVSLFNIILSKSNIKALQLEDELNLPLHLPMPKLSKPKEENKTN